MWLGIHTNLLDVTNSFQVGVVRHAQSDSKQINYILKINVDIKLIFLMWLVIHKYIYLIQYIIWDGFGQAHLSMPKVIPITKSA